MYDIPFSQQWILDLCLNDLNVVKIFIVVPLIIIICTLLYQLLRFRDIKELGLRLITSIFLLFIFIPMYYIFFFLVGIFNCSMANTFYEGVGPAHAIHAQIKQRIKENKNIPQNLSDLRKMDPKNYFHMATYAKVNYIYDSKTKNYTFFVRPSRYLMIIFDSKKDYKLYGIRTIIAGSDDDSGQVWGGNYPPNYPGPWDKLPK